MAEGCVRHGWDSCVDYKKAYGEILSHLYKTGSPYDVVLLIQLRNGSRINEAIEATKAFCNTRDYTVRVTVEKHKGTDTRLMVLPEELRSKEGREYLSNACLRLARVKKPRDTVRDYCHRVYGFNTHSLRYAFITYMLSRGVSPSFIAKMTGHKNLGYILHYTEIKTAEDLLMNIK